jgi:hypothetical protein
VIIREIVIVASAMLLLAGCAVDTTPEPEVASPVAEPTPTPTPELEVLDPSGFATQVDLFGPGVDFDSGDRNIHCGIWDDRGSAYVGRSGPYAGCRPAEANYQTDPASFSEVGCRGGVLVADAPAHPVCDSGQAFVGEDPSQYTVGVIGPGESIAYAGYTCTSPDPTAIQCVRDADGAGFLVSGTDYRYF